MPYSTTTNFTLTRVYSHLCGTKRKLDCILNFVSSSTLNWC